MHTEIHTNTHTHVFKIYKPVKFYHAHIFPICPDINYKSVVTLISRCMISDGKLLDPSDDMILANNTQDESPMPSY